MTKAPTYDKVIKDHERRIKRIESHLFKIRIEPPKDKQSLTDHILALRTSSFFAQPKTAEETHKKLITNYHCELNRVAMALLRLANRKQLRKASRIINGKKYKAFVW